MKHIVIDNISFRYPIWKDQHNSFFKTLKANSTTIANTLRPERIQIVGIGSSGTFIGAIIYKELFEMGGYVTLNIVQKEGVHHHHGTDIPDTLCKDCFTLIVDDFVGSGNTLNHLYERIEDRIDTKNVGVYVANESNIKNITNKLIFNIKYLFSC